MMRCVMMTRKTTALCSLADQTACTSHADCTIVQAASGQVIGTTYCYDQGIFNGGMGGGTANGVLTCAANAPDCCACRDNDSFDQNAANCPVASNCCAHCPDNCNSSVGIYTSMTTIMLLVGFMAMF